MASTCIIALAFSFFSLKKSYTELFSIWKGQSDRCKRGGKCMVRDKKSCFLIDGSVNPKNPFLVKAMVCPRTQQPGWDLSVSGSPGEKQAELTVWLMRASPLLGKSGMSAMTCHCHGPSHSPLLPKQPTHIFMKWLWGTETRRFGEFIRQLRELEKKKKRVR